MLCKVFPMLVDGSMLEKYCQTYTDSYMSQKFWQLHVLQKLTVTCHVFAKFTQAACQTVTCQNFSKQRSYIDNSRE